MAVLGTYNYQSPYFFDTVQGPLPGNSMWERFSLLASVCDPFGFTPYHNDFIGVSPATNTINGWTFTSVTSGGITEDTTNPGGILLLSAGAVTATQGINWQTTGTPFKIAANKPIGFEVYGKFTGLSATTKVQFFAGLATQTTALIATSAFANFDHVGIGGVSTTGVLQGRTQLSNTATTKTGQTIVDATFYRFGFIATSTQVDFYVNGALISSSTTNIPTAALAPIIVMQANATVTPVFNLDYIKVCGYR